MRKALLFPRVPPTPTIVTHNVNSESTISYPVGTDVGDFVIIAMSGLGPGGWPFVSSNSGNGVWSHIVVRAGTGSTDSCFAWKKLGSEDLSTTTLRKASSEDAAVIILKNVNYARVATYYSSATSSTTFTIPSFSTEWGRNGLVLGAVVQRDPGLVRHYTPPTNYTTALKTDSDQSEQLLAYNFSQWGASSLLNTFETAKNAFMSAVLELFYDSVTPTATAATHISSGTTLSGVQAGDLVIAYTASGSGTSTFTPGTGWTAIPHIQSSNGYNYHVAWKVMTNTTYNNHNLPGTGTKLYACYRGPTSVALRGSVSSSTGVNTVRIGWSDVAISRACKGLVTLITNRDNDATQTAPSGWNSRYNAIADTHWKAGIADKLSSLTSSTSLYWSAIDGVGGFGKDTWLLELL